MFDDIKQFSFSPMHMTMRYPLCSKFSYIILHYFSEFSRLSGMLLSSSSSPTLTAPGLASPALFIPNWLPPRQRVSGQLHVMQRRSSQKTSRKSSNQGLASGLFSQNLSWAATVTLETWPEDSSKQQQYLQISLESQKTSSQLSGSSLLPSTAPVSKISRSMKSRLKKRSTCGARCSPK